MGHSWARIKTVEGDQVVLDFNHPKQEKSLILKLRWVSFSGWFNSMKKAELLEAYEITKN